MKHLIQKYSYTRSDIVGHISSGNFGFCLISSDNSIRGIVNGSEVLKEEKNKEAHETIAPVLAGLIHNFVPSPEKGVVIYKSEWPVIGKASSSQYLDSLFEYLPRYYKASVIQILDKPKEPRNMEDSLSPRFNITGTIPPEALKVNLSVFLSKLRDLPKVLQGGIEDSMMLVRKKLVPSMWGAKMTQKFIDNARNKILRDSDSWSKIEFHMDMINKSVLRLLVKLSDNMNEEDRKIVSAILIPNIINNYEALKDTVIKASMALTPLVYIDDVFQKNTSYPASWFFTDDIVKSVKNCYDYLLKFLSEVPIIESKVIYPLDLYKVQISS